MQDTTPTPTAAAGRAATAIADLAYALITGGGQLDPRDTSDILMHLARITEVTTEVAGIIHTQTRSGVWGGRIAAREYEQETTPDLLAACGRATGDAQDTLVTATGHLYSMHAAIVQMDTTTTDA